MRPIASTYYQDAAERFSRDVAGHEMTVLHDDGLYRHIRFKKPGTMSYYFDLITWPGSLVIKADMGTYVFTREPDMIRDFFPDRWTSVNADYWAEKMPGGLDSVEELSEKKLRGYVWKEYREHCARVALTPEERAELWSDLRRRILDDPHDVHTAVAALHHYTDPDFDWLKTTRSRDRLSFDVSELTTRLTEFSYHYLWCCCAIAAGCRDYIAAYPREAAA